MTLRDTYLLFERRFYFLFTVFFLVFGTMACNGAKQMLFRDEPGCAKASVGPLDIRAALTCDKAGNGPVNIVSNSNDYVSSLGFTSSILTWNTTQLGLLYEVRVGGVDCTTGTLVTGANATGTTAAADVATTLPIADLAVGANTIRICVTVSAGNFVAATYTVTRDETAPTITLRETQDLDGNGKIDAIKITFAEPILDSSVVPASFTIAGYASPAFSSTTNGDVANDNVIYITFTELVASCGTSGNTGCDTGFTPNLTVAASAVRDRSNIPVAASGPTITTDKALPIIVAATAENLRRKLIVVFSEPVYNAAGAPACPGGGLASSYFTYNNNAAGGATALHATIVKGCGSNNRIILRTTTKFRRADLNTVSGDSIAPAAATIFDAGGNLAAATAKIIIERKNMDLNGDGIPDLIIAASSSQTGLNDRGEVYVYFGSASNISGNCAAYPCTLNATTHPDVIIQGAAANDRLGISVSSPGDVNGDGFDDLIIGASSAAAGGTSRGEAYVYFGSATNISGDCASYPCTLNATTHPDIKIQGAVNSDFLGNTVATAGDINDDGMDDFIVGASGSDSGAANAGEVYVYFGSSTNISGNCAAYPCTLNATTHPDIKVQGAATTTGVGQPGLGGASDLNDDQVDDLVVSAPSANAGNTLRGEVYAYFGSATNISGDCPAYPCTLNSAAHPDIKIQGTFDNDLIESASLNGDFNGDGVTDLLIGAPNRLTSAVMGESYVLFGGNNFSGDCGAYPCTLQTQTHADVIMQGGADHGDTLNNLAEISVASVGDINNDGIDDISVGSELATGAGGQAAWRGQMKFFFGGSNISGDCPFYPCTLNSTTHPDIKIIGPTDNMQLGRASARAGDVNGDGINDFLVGAHRANGVRGEAYVYFGGANVSGNCAAYPCVLDNTGNPDVKIQGTNTTDFLGDGLY